MRRWILHLDLTTARLFVTTIEQESIAEAAREHAIAPSAVSKRIQQLEGEIGMPLLVRHRRGVEPTAAGLVVLRRARAMIHEAMQLEADLAGMREGLTGRVRLCANETALIEFVPAVVADFVAAHPGVEVELDERPSTAVVRAIWQNAADLGIYVGDVPPIDLWRRPVFQDRLVLVTMQDHPLAAKHEVSMADILHHEVIGQTTEGALSMLLTRAAASYHRVLKMRLFADGYDTVCSLVGRGLAVGIVAESAARIFAPRFGLAVLAITDGWADREHQVCARSLRGLAPPQQALLDHILRQGERGAT
ncbi:LysR substrate-binding domain-containing protein [Enterovirga rhinocerotis]|uniref:DNA-binding transcriptional LysR family regulator n=1 Tax=Enterovirga rhinocerotis TaxID=1339210 RepID=A0A4R7C4L3_9HYPH|nr:LysR substrate-binding domain-containing protein [Enterovirga rhinocerotis]TDR92953.1 DNA-binding transcriptional LysR family regulator [Enterovirga rhinocerotis]